MDDKFDAPLLGILQNCGELEPFLEVILGFLFRKTDFFRPLSADQTMGFPPGVARDKLLKVFKKFEKISSTSLARSDKTNSGSVPRSPPVSQHHPPTPPATPGLVAAPPATQILPPPVATSITPAVANITPAVPNITPAVPNITPAVPNITPAVPIKEEIQGDWTTSNWDHHNGGVTETYAWSQTGQDVELKMVLPNQQIKAADLKIDIKAHSLKVQIKQETDLKTLLEEKLHSSVKPEESMWSLHKGECLQINLEKGRDGYWWTGMFEGGNEIKLDTIDTTRSIAEFGQEEQACVQKLMFDQRQKMLGQPTSDELETEDILKKAWNAEGSPFAGTPYDRSRINMSNTAGGQTGGT